MRVQVHYMSPEITAPEDGKTYHLHKTLILEDIATIENKHNAIEFFRNGMVVAMFNPSYLLFYEELEYNNHD